MTYTAKYVTGGWFEDSNIGEAFGTTSTLLTSWWMEQPQTFSYFVENARFSGTGHGMGGFTMHGFGNTVEILLGSQLLYGSHVPPNIINVGIVEFDTTGVWNQTYNNVMVSVDTTTQTVQMYVNDVACVQTSNTWYGSDPLNFASAQRIQQTLLVATGPCTADIFWDTPSLFFDLSIESNRRKFIASDLTPVYLGTDGSIPFGTQPKLFMSNLPGGTTTDFLTNLGTMGGTFTQTGTPAFCGPDPNVNVHITGVHGTGQVGTPTLHIVNPSRLQMSELDVVQAVDVPNHRQMSLRYSDDGGANWSNPINQTVGQLGEYKTDIQWRRLGLARNRVIELSWSNDFATALTGAMIEYSIAAT